MGCRTREFSLRVEGIEARMLLDGTSQGLGSPIPPMLASPAPALQPPWPATTVGQPSGFPGAASGVTDPSIIKQGATYYLFSTGPGIPIRASNDLIHWELIGQVFAGIPGWAQAKVPGATALWAPDISFFNGEYHLYYAVSTFGSGRSVIGLATSPTLDPSAADYGWIDRGEVIESRPGRTNWNAIDPSIVVVDNSSVWLAFGSQWSGIKVLRIDPQTGKPFGQGPSSGTRLYAIAGRPSSRPIEAASIINRNGYYYLFVSFDKCCQGAASTYKIMVGRSRAITGPYRDRQGQPMTRGGGTLVLGSAGRYRGPGSSTILHDGGQDWIVYHYYDAQDGGVPKVELRPLSWASDGWPAVGEPLL
jgi:arabinan endo-1,5-alpha-L-arabinosidase